MLEMSCKIRQIRQKSQYGANALDHNASDKEAGVQGRIGEGGRFLGKFNSMFSYASFV